MWNKWRISQTSEKKGQKLTNFCKKNDKVVKQKWLNLTN